MNFLSISKLKISNFFLINFIIIIQKKLIELIISFFLIYFKSFLNDLISFKKMKWNEFSFNK